MKHSKDDNVRRREFSGVALGVTGRFHNVITAYDDPKRIVNQKFVARRDVPGSGKGVLFTAGADGETKQRDVQLQSLKVTLRFDDSCNNGHESFAITGELYEGFREVASGCLHEEIAKTFPEFEPLIKWHLCSIDGPMHYVANTCYHAGDRDHWGLRKGEESTSPRQMKHFLRFGNSPVEHEVSVMLKEFIEQTFYDGAEFVIDEVRHAGFSSKYQFAGMDCQWHECPFDSEKECRQWLNALTACVLNWDSRTEMFGEGKQRELDAARSAAIWPEATDEQLCLERPELEALLLARLPALLADFRAEMGSVGFIYPK